MNNAWKALAPFMSQVKDVSSADLQLPVLVFTLAFFVTVSCILCVVGAVLCCCRSRLLEGPGHEIQQEQPLLIHTSAGSMPNSRSCRQRPMSKLFLHSRWLRDMSRLPKGGVKEEFEESDEAEDDEALEAERIALENEIGPWDSVSVAWQGRPTSSSKNEFAQTPRTTRARSSVSRAHSVPLELEPGVACCEVPGLSFDSAQSQCGTSSRPSQHYTSLACASRCGVRLGNPVRPMAIAEAPRESEVIEL